MKTLIHAELAQAGEKARSLRQLPGATLRLPPPLSEHQPFVDKVWRKSQPKPQARKLSLKA